MANKNPRSSADLLRGKSLNWVCLDNRGICAVHVRDLLLRWATEQNAAGATEVQVRLCKHCTDWRTPEIRKSVLATFVHSEVSLLVAHISETEELDGSIKLLAQLEKLPRRVQRACWLAPELSDWTPILLEAGAQVVVSQLTFLESAIYGLLDEVSLSNKGFHPLTSGLLERLPWQHLG